MDVVEHITEVNCPKCGQSITPNVDMGPSTSCPNCRWKGEVYLFTPLKRVIEEAHEAVPENAICAHHPTKRAVAICEGTGSYICSLCHVEIDGRSYSVQYVDGKGYHAIRKEFDRYLDRPDYFLGLLLAMHLFFFYATPILFPLAIHRYIKMLKLRRENEAYRRLIGKDRVIMYSLLTFTMGPAILIFSIFFFFSTLF